MALFALQALLMVMSWLLSAAFPLSGIHSLLSGEGLRWLMGYYADQLATPYLVWLLLALMAGGCLYSCGLLAHLRTLTARKASYRESRALLFSVLWLVFYVGAMLLLTVMPHAILLSATGHLWPSPFSASLLPVTMFGILMTAVVYGLVSDHFTNLTAIYDSLLHGLRWGTPLLLFYVLVMQLHCSILFVLP
jgi:aminobenzoyl-glutamate transport protein